MAAVSRSIWHSSQHETRLYNVGVVGRCGRICIVNMTPAIFFRFICQSTVERVLTLYNSLLQSRLSGTDHETSIRSVVIALAIDQSRQTFFFVFFHPSVISHITPQFLELSHGLLTFTYRRQHELRSSRRPGILQLLTCTGLRSRCWSRIYLA